MNRQATLLHSVRTIFRPRVLPCAILFGVFFLSYLVTSAITPGNHRAPELFIPSENLELGDVWENSILKRTIPLKNLTDRTIEIHGFDLSCTCFAVEPAKLSIRPQGEAEVTVRLDLRRQTPKDPSKITQSFAVHFVPRLRDPQYPTKVWNVRGTIRRAILLDRSLLRFPSLVAGQSWPSQTVRIRATLPLRDLQAKCDTNHGIARVLSGNDSKGEFRVVISLNPRLPPGPVDFIVELDASLQTGQLVPSVKLPVRAAVVSDIHALPDQIMLAACPLGKLQEETVLLRSHLGRRFQLDGFNVSSPAIEVARANDCNSDDLAFRIRVKPTLKGSFVGNVVFLVRDDAEKTTNVNLQVCTYIK